MICRLCIDSNSVKMYNIYTYKDPDPEGIACLGNSILTLFSIKVKQNDNMPQTICESCLNIIKNLSLLRKRFIANNEILKDQYNLIKKKMMEQYIENMNSHQRETSTSEESSPPNLIEYDGHLVSNFNYQNPPVLKRMLGSKKRKHYQKNNLINSDNDEYHEISSDGKNIKDKEKCNIISEHSYAEELSLHKYCKIRQRRSRSKSSSFERSTPESDISESQCFVKDSPVKTILFKSCKVPADLETVNLSPNVLVSKLNDRELNRLCDTYKINSRCENDIRFTICCYEEKKLNCNLDSTTRNTEDKKEPVYSRSEWEKFENNLYGGENNVDNSTPESLLLLEGEQVPVELCIICNEIFESRRKLAFHMRKHKNFIDKASARYDTVNILPQNKSVSEFDKS